MAVYVVLRHPDAEQLWANEWTEGTPLIKVITTDKVVAAQCQTAMAAGEYVYVHRCAHGTTPAMIVSKAKVQAIKPVDRTMILVWFCDQQAVGKQPSRHVEQGMRSYAAAPAD